MNNDRYCKECGIKISESIKVKYKKILMCKFCYRKYQQEQFKFWYEKNKSKKKKIKYKLVCEYCCVTFESNVFRKTCCKEHQKLRKKAYNRLLHRRKKK